MNNLYIYLNVALITVIICTIYAVFYFSKTIADQRQVQRDLINMIKEVKKICKH